MALVSPRHKHVVSLTESKTPYRSRRWHTDAPYTPTPPTYLSRIFLTNRSYLGSLVTLSGHTLVWGDNIQLFRIKLLFPSGKVGGTPQITAAVGGGVVKVEGSSFST